MVTILDWKPYLRQAAPASFSKICAFPVREMTFARSGGSRKFEILKIVRSPQTLKYIRKNNLAKPRLSILILIFLISELE